MSDERNGEAQRRLWELSRDVSRLSQQMERAESDIRAIAPTLLEHHELKAKLGRAVDDIRDLEAAVATEARLRAEGDEQRSEAIGRERSTKRAALYSLIGTLVLAGGGIVVAILQGVLR